MTNGKSTWTNRALVGAALLALTLFLAYGKVSPPGAWAATAQSATGCTGGITPAVTEGPYYKAGSPERASLLTAGTTGTKVTITGYVYDKNCQAISHAWLDFWQADANGSYDNTGYTLRGHQYTDASGAYKLETVVPGEYPGRTEHIHVKVQAPNGPVLTTQLFFPGVADNSNDSIFDKALLMDVQDGATGKTATYSFVLNVTAAAPAQATATAVPAAAPTADPPSASHTFNETGITVSGDFWTAWQGGRSYSDSLYINGLPITDVRNEVSTTDGKTYSTQWFERARFEAHPENAAPNNVLLGLLGTAAAKGKQSLAAFKAVSNPGGGVAWFSQTGHTLGDSSTGGQAIAAAWNRLGGLRQFGYPLSQPFMEVSKDDGKSYLVQYFERQRFEYHPENKGTIYEVLLGRLGAEQAKNVASVKTGLQTLASGFGSPDDLTVTPAGDIIFGDFGNGALNILTPGGTPKVLVKGFNEPEGIVVALDGALIVAEQGTNRILEVNAQTGAKKVLRQMVNNTGQDGLDGLGLDTATGDILVPDSPNGKLLRMSRDGSQLTTIATGFVRPTGAAVESGGTIIVADEFGNAVYRVQKDGSRTKLASLYQPDDVVIGSDGTIYVNGLGGVIAAINPTSGKLTQLASGLNLPHGIGVAGKELFIAEAGRNRILQLSLQ